MNQSTRASPPAKPVAPPPAAGRQDGGGDPAAEVARLRAALAAAEAREAALLHELQHRVRNMLAVIRSTYRRTRETGARDDEFADHFQGRLDAIVRYQSHIDAGRDSGVELEDMLRDELLQAHCLDGPNCTVEGPPVRLTGKTAELIGLAIHELTTNSIKFGALGLDGRLHVTWSVEESVGGSQLAFDWVETGVAPLGTAPRPSGFGRQLIEDALPYQLDAITSFELKAGGLHCHIRLPLPAGASGGNADGQEQEESRLAAATAEAGR